MTRTAYLALVLAVVVPRPAAAQDVRVDDLITRASAYIASFITRFSSLVAEEEYLQDVAFTSVMIRGGAVGVGAPDRLYRKLTSDFLLVKPTDANTVVAFRDVLAIDDIPVPDRDERLARLFIEAAGTDAERARAIATESARHNLGPVIRENNPLLVLGFLQPAYRHRFQFTLGRTDRIEGRAVRVVNYVETTRPTLLTSRQLLDETARGRVWLEPSTGRPVRTELATRLVTVTTTFVFDAQLGIDVPIEMVEAYRQAGNAGAAIARGTAKYGRFRRFEVTTEETIR